MRHQYANRLALIVGMIIVILAALLAWLQSR
jgi:hypothetical protein